VEFKAGVETALAYALRLKTVRVHAMAGIAPAGADPEALKTTYVANLKFAAERFAKHGITLLMEAINTRDMPGFYLNMQAQSYAMLAAVNAPNLKMQMDCYHMQIMEGDLAVKLRKYAAYCGHVQVAGVPERHEPDTGEIRYSYVFNLLDEIGYDGWVGCEYRPAGKTVDGLGWFKKF
jgi:hydroxypyruvate isomerase